MQELTFEQVGIVVGGNGGESGESTDNSSVETNTIKVKVDATGCGAAEVAKDAYVGAGAMAGGIILGATTWGLGAYVGGFLGGIAGSLAWQASEDEVINTLCN